MIRLSEMIKRSEQGECFPPMVSEHEIMRPAVAMSRMIAFCRARGLRRCIQCGEVDSRTVLHSGIFCVACHRSDDPTFRTWF